MRILHVIHSPQRRGAETFALQLANELNSQSDVNLVVSLYDPLKQTEFGGDTIARLGGRQSFSEKIIGVQWNLSKKLHQAARAFLPDIIVAHGSASLKYCSLLRLTFRRSVFVYRCIGLPSFWAHNGSKRIVNKILLSRFDWIVCVSSAARKDFLRHYQICPDTVSIIRNGVDVKPFMYGRDQKTGVRESLRRAFEISLDAPVLVSVGNLSEEKNHAEMLVIMKELKERDSRLHLIIVGDGPLRRNIQRSALRMGIARRVHLTGDCDKVPEVLAASDIFLMTSKTESMPAALIEAGLAGLPAVSYDVGGVREILSDTKTGFLVPYLDRRSFIAAVMSLLADPAKSRRMGNVARHDYRERFGIGGVAQEYRALFDELLREERRTEVGNS